MNRLRLGEGLVSLLAWGLAAMATGCAQVSERGKPQVTTGDAGQGSGGSANLDPVAVPLRDTVLCGHDFLRVDELPDVAPFFSGTFDGEPVNVSESVDVSEAPTFYVLRFGATQVEAISFGFYLAEGPYQGFLQVNAADCGTYGNFLHPEAEGPHYYELDSAELVTITQSVDGFTGLTTGRVSASWSDDGERHALTADFVLTAIMGDASTQR